MAPVTTGVIGANPPSLLARVGQGQRAFEGRVPLGGVDSGRFTNAGSGFTPKRTAANRKHLRPLLCGRNVFERNSSGRAVNSIRSSVTDATRLLIESDPLRVAKTTTAPYKHQLLRLERSYLVDG